MEPMLNYTGPNPSDDAYVQALERQCQDWEEMYANLKSENEQLKKRIDIILHGATAMTEKSPASPAPQIRHV